MGRGRLRNLWLLVLATTVLAGTSELPGSPGNSNATPASQVTGDPVSRLQKRIDQGQVNLTFDDKFGYLPSVLRELHVPVSSQVLVFSKTSLRTELICPQTPRALYLTDDVAVGLVPGSGELEFAVLDPKEGVTFYVLPQAPSSRPRFDNKIGCMRCHVSPETLQMPGLLVRSVFADASGTPAPGAKVFNTSHQTSLKSRWGGWYVTGETGNQDHMGNSVVRKGGKPQELETEGTRNWQDLKGHVPVDLFPTPYSDVVALMVLEHQARMVNLILRADWVSDSGPRQIDAAIEELLKYMLFTKEARLAAPIHGTSGFAVDFAKRGPRDSRGRSLRDLDMRTRMFRFPCSYMIYSDAFNALPTNVRDRLYHRLWEVLTEKDTSPQFAHLSAADRKAILEILKGTKRGLPAYWLAHAQ
jgi:hypothetical protein